MPISGLKLSRSRMAFRVVYCHQVLKELMPIILEKKNGGATLSTFPEAMREGTEEDSHDSYSLT